MIVKIEGNPDFTPPQRPETLTPSLDTLVQERTGEPNWTPGKHYPGISLEELKEAHRQDQAAMAEFYKPIDQQYAERSKFCRSLVSLVNALYGEDNKFSQYAKKEITPQVPGGTRPWSLPCLTATEKAYQSAKEEARRDAGIKKQERAIQYILEHQGSLPEDFTLAKAVSIANDICWEQEIEPKLPEEYDIKCCEYCSTWERGEHRCSCGNRRIYLEWDGDFENHGFTYPMAD